MVGGSRPGAGVAGTVGDGGIVPVGERMVTMADIDRANLQENTPYFVTYEGKRRKLYFEWKYHTGGDGTRSFRQWYLWDTKKWFGNSYVDRNATKIETVEE